MPSTVRGAYRGDRASATRNSCVSCGTTVSLAFDGPTAARPVDGEC